RLLAEDADVFGLSALGERLGLLDPVVALDAALEVQIAVHPFTLVLLPRSHLLEPVDAEPVQDRLVFGADAGDKLQVVGLRRLLHADWAIRRIERRLCLGQRRPGGATRLL